MDDPKLTEDEARALWERAARLQAEAAARELAAPSTDEPSTSDRSRAGDYSVEVVRRAAEEAGIAREFVDRALEERSFEGDASGAVDRWADAMLGEGPRVSRVTGVVEGSVEEVFESLRRVLPNAPFGFSLSGTRNGAPLDGGTLVFEVPYYGTSGSVGQPSGPVMDIRHWADLKEVFVRLVPVKVEEGEDPRTEIQVWASTAYARRVNFWVGGLGAGFVGAAAGLAGFLVTGGLVDMAAATELALQLGAGAASGLTGLWGAVRGWRPIYRYGQKKGQGGMQRIIDAVRVDLQTGGGFTPAPAPRQIGGGDTLSGMLNDLGL